MMDEPHVTDEFDVLWRTQNLPFCDKCGLPARRGSMGYSVHVSDAFPTGIPPEKDKSGHTPSIRKWWEAQ